MIRDGSCDYITEVELILLHLARAGHNLLNNGLRIKFVDVLLRANCSSSFIHHDDFTFIRGEVTERRITTACASVESCQVGRIID